MGSPMVLPMVHLWFATQGPLPGVSYSTNPLSSPCGSWIPAD